MDLFGNSVTVKKSDHLAKPTPSSLTLATIP